MLHWLVEEKILDAIGRGELDDLPGTGRPLDLDDDRLVPEDLRAVYRILKNAGYLPLEVETLQEIAALERLACEGEPEARVRAVRKLALLRTRIERAYCEKALSKLSRATA